MCGRKRREEGGGRRSGGRGERREGGGELAPERERGAGGPDARATRGAEKRERSGGSLLGAGLCLHFPHPPHRVPSLCRGCWVLREPTRQVQGGRTGIQATAADSTAALEHPPGAGRCARRRQPQGRSGLVRDTVGSVWDDWYTTSLNPTPTQRTRDFQTHFINES